MKKVSCWMPPSSAFINTAQGKRGQQFQAIGRSRGGLTSKIHALIDGLGTPLRFEVTAGNINDCVTGYEIL